MADQKLSELTELATAPASGDQVYIQDVSEGVPANQSKRITIANLVGLPDASTIENSAGTLRVKDDGITNAKLANMAQSTIKGRAAAAGTGDPTDLTATQATAILDNVVGDSGSGGTKGLVPAPGAGDAAAGKFLKADGTFAVPSGSGVTDAKYVVSAAHGSLSAEIVIPGLGGSPDRAAIGGGGTSREFESGDTAPTWSPSSPATVNVGTTIPSHIYIAPTTTTEYLGTYAWSPAGAFDAIMKVALGSSIASNYVNVALHIGDSDNSNRVMTYLEAGNTSPLVKAFTYTSATYTQRGSNQTQRDLEMYLRVTRDGSNNVSFWFSDNGKIWHFIATQAFTFTVANIGFRLAAGSAAEYYVAADFLRTDV